MSALALRRLGVLALLAALLVPSTAQAQKRQPKDIVAELSQVARRMERYEFESHVNPRFRHQMPGELTGEYQQHLKLLDELSVASAAEKVAVRPLISRDLAILALFKDETAAKRIETLKTSKVPAEALLGKMADLQLSWWADPTADNQTKVLADLQALAKANAADDAMTTVLLDLARAGAANEELADKARVVVETDLKGPSAQKYKARPDKVGRPLVINGMTVQGKPFSTESMKGKVIIVDFWATWCGPCREALPELISFYKENKEKGLEVVGVSCDSRKPDLIEFLKQNPDMNWPNLFGPSGGSGWHALAQKFEIRGIPTIYVIDRDGILRSTKWLDQKKILALLEQPAKTTPATGKPGATPAGKSAAATPAGK